MSNTPLEGEVVNNKVRTPLLSYRVVNTLTGEISEEDLYSIEEVADHYQRLSADVKTIKNAIEKLKVFLERWLDQQGMDIYELPDRRQLKIFFRQTKQIRREDLSRFLDADTIDALLKVDNTAAKEVIQDMAQRGELVRDAWKEIQENATVTSTSKYVRVIK